LPVPLAEDKDRLARFEREAKLLASLNRAHIASVYGLAEHEGTLYIAMKLVEGETLETKLKAGALPVWDAVLKYPHDDGGRLDAGDDQQPATAAPAGLHFDSDKRSDAENASVRLRRCAQDSGHVAGRRSMSRGDCQLRQCASWTRYGVFGA
jgi:hypothetical protein